jgi:hypothetical protein
MRRRPSGFYVRFPLSRLGNVMPRITDLLIVTEQKGIRVALASRPEEAIDAVHLVEGTDLEPDFRQTVSEGKVFRLDPQLNRLPLKVSDSVASLIPLLIKQRVKPILNFVPTCGSPVAVKGPKYRFLHHYITKSE